MTLVQNLQQQLSGNKHLIFIVLLAFTLQSCSVFESIFGGKRPTPPPPIEESDEPDVIDGNYPDGDTKPNEEVDVDTLIIPDPVQLKEEFNIAVMLPFQLNQLENGTSFNSANKASFELYKGIKLALSKVDFDDKVLNIYVLDTEKDEATTRNLLSSEPFPAVNAVIGPLYSKNISVVSSYAKENQIPFISPLSSVNDLAKNNAFILSANPTKETRYSVLLDYLSKEFINPNIGIVYSPLKKEQEARNEIVKIGAEKEITIIEKVSQGREMFSVVEGMLETGRENVIIVPADDNEEGTIYMDRLLSFMNDLGSKFDINVVGLSEWNTVTQFSPEKYPNLDLYILDRYFVDEYDSKASNLLQSLKSRNDGMDLTMYNLQGYDIMAYLSELIDKKGDKFVKSITKTKYDGIQTRYNFDKFVVNNEAQFIENKYINILEFSNGKWRRVN